MSPRAALHAAACFAQQFKAAVCVAFVEDPLLASGATRLEVPIGEQEVARFVAEAGDAPLRDARIIVVTATNAAGRIVTLASEQDADLIVMGAHGLSGVRKAFFGSH